MSTGRFCWFDLMTSDVASAKSFYTALFGWVFVDHNPAYTMIQDPAGRGLGGLMAAGPGQPNAWLPYVSADDLDAVVAKIRDGGGKVFMQHAAPGAGRFAIYADPQGAVLAAIQLEKDDGTYPREKSQNHICWAELQSPDPAAALAFHQGVYGWAHEAWGSDYFLIGSEHAGGINRAQPGVPPHWLIYVNTAPADASAARVTELGGKVLAPPQAMGEVGRFAVFADPQGAVFAVMESARRA